MRRSTFEIPAAHPVLRRTREWRGATAGVVLANVPPGHPPSVLPRQLPVARSVRAALQTDQYTHSTSLQLLTLAYTVALATRDEVRKTENTAGPSNPPQCQSARCCGTPHALTCGYTRAGRLQPGHTAQARSARSRHGGGTGGAPENPCAHDEQPKKCRVLAGGHRCTGELTIVTIIVCRAANNSLLRTQSQRPARAPAPSTSVGTRTHETHTRTHQAGTRTYAGQSLSLSLSLSPPHRPPLSLTTGVARRRT